MSWRNPAWDVVGIEPTGDLRAIRVAYTQRLKTIDVEADPQAFIALREAYEACQREAEWVDRVWDEDEEETDEAEDAEFPPAQSPDPFGVISDAEVSSLASASDLPNRNAQDGAQPVLRALDAEPVAPLDRQPSEPSPPPPPEVPHPRPWGARTLSEQAQAHAEALTRLLQELGEAEGAGHAAEMVTHWHAIVADPRMEDIAFYADAETWLAGLLARSIPASDPLLGYAAEYFGWYGEADKIGQRHSVAYVLQRCKALAFRHAVLQRKHPLHRAWKELERPAGEGSRRGTANPASVRTLIARVRRDFPDLESEWDWYRVSMWEDAGRARSGFTRWLGRLSVIFVIGFIGLLGLAADLVKDTSPRPPNPVLAQFEKLGDQDADIAFLLAHTGDGSLKWADVQKRNPKLADAIRADWSVGRKAGENRAQFSNGMYDTLSDRFGAGLAQAPYPLIAEYRGLKRDVAKSLLATSAKLCDDYMHGTTLPKDSIAKPFLDRYRALLAKVLIATEPDPVRKPGPTSFSIPAQVTDDAVRRSGLGRERLVAALNEKGTDSDRCRARIALIDAALALPEAKGLKLLREM